LSGNYKDAVETLQPLMDKRETDEAFYDVLAASWAAQDDARKAKTVLKNGLQHFPASGLLYYDLGHLYDMEKKPEEALKAWEEGINANPGYARNYCNAAKKYLNSEDVMPGLLYGEIYLNIAQDTDDADTLKKMLFSGYKKMFDNIAKPDRVEQSEQQEATAFMDAVKKTYAKLTPVVSDGVTTENLTMVRIRFLMDWYDTYGGKYPYSLFAYHDYLVRNGLFDIYNEWLFGKAESITEYKAWNQFHAGEMDIFLEKKAAHGLRPGQTDIYSSEGVAPKRKK
jgi:tetratricopeptide (TPR) repeat protein